MEHRNEIKLELPHGTEVSYPIRLNRYLALANVASRREADAIIKSGAVKVNGRQAGLGDKVEATDDVRITEKTRKRPKAYIVYSKPRDVATLSGGRTDALVDAAHKLGLAAVEDLDKHSEGLVLLTNDGRIARIAATGEPLQSFDVKVQEDLSPSFETKIVAGVPVGKDVVRAESAEVIGERRFKVTLFGGEAAVRGICESLHRTAVSIRRTSFAGLTLKGIPQSKWRELGASEIDLLLSAFGIE